MRIELLTPDGEKYVPLPAQAAFHGSPCKFRALVAGFGSGKTLAGAMETLVTALEFPNSLTLVSRFTYRELQETTWDTLLKVVPTELVKDANKSTPYVVLKNGSKIVGWNCENHQNMQSLNLSAAWIDECNEDGIGEQHFRQLQGRLRSGVGPRKIWLTGNPAGRNWVYNLFFAHMFDPSAKKYANHEGFRAGTQENLHLPPDYIQSLRDFYDEDWLAKFFEGSFSIFEGQILDNFREEIHVVDEFRPPDEWPRFRGLDHGLTAPTACLWASADFDGNLVIFREYYKKESVVEENVRQILAMSHGEPEPEWTVIDPATNQRAANTGDRYIDLYRKAGLMCQGGDNSFKPSVARLRSMLAPDPGHRFPVWHERSGEYGAPHLYVTRDCKWLRWEIEQWSWKNVKPGQANREQQRDQDNHALSALRYIAMRNPRKAVEAVSGTQYERFLAIAAEMEGRSTTDRDLEDPRNLIGYGGVF